jgi:hypothetical protein
MQGVEWSFSCIAGKFLQYRKRGGEILYQFQIKDEIKAARIEATKTYITYVEELKTSQRR